MNEPFATMKLSFAVASFALLFAKASAQQPEVCAADCYCIPDDENSTCPPLGDRIIAASPEAEIAREFFFGLVVRDASLFRSEPAGCQPFPLVANVLQVEECKGLSGRHSKKDPIYCAFAYDENSVCETAKYRIVERGTKTKKIRSSKRRIAKKRPKKNSKKLATSITHQGACGACSTAQDLGVYLTPTVLADAFACNSILQDSTKPPKEALEEAQACFENIGFTRDCAFVWASNSLNTNLAINAALAAIPDGPVFDGPVSCTQCALAILECNQNPATCGALQLPLTPGTCDLSPCVLCDEEVSGPIFQQYAGRTRRNTGIVTTFPSETGFAGLKRPCSSIANLPRKLFAKCNAVVAIA